MKPLYLASIIVLCTSYGAYAQQSPNDMQQLMQNMQRMIQQEGAQGNFSPEWIAKQQRNLQLGVVTSKIHRCIEDAVGKPRLDAFMDEMNGVGQTIEGHCKSQQAEEARALAISTLNAKFNDPVAIAARYCYNEHKIDLEPLLTSKAAMDAANYERWAEDPSAAEREVKPTDICK